MSHFDLPRSVLSPPFDVFPDARECDSYHNAFVSETPLLAMSTTSKPLIESFSSEDRDAEEVSCSLRWLTFGSTLIGLHGTKCVRI